MDVHGRTSSINNLGSIISDQPEANGEDSTDAMRADMLGFHDIRGR